mgnify:CR=1 FL=1
MILYPSTTQSHQVSKVVCSQAELSTFQQQEEQRARVERIQAVRSREAMFSKEAV